ncbi:MAG: Gfo/Idh/MocA family oxidoreductase [Bacteroidales bacterium]|nr:Gfo/Idh/MocA family oxidoreductase [Bacteroidales bacterium]
MSRKKQTASRRGFLKVSAAAAAGAAVLPTAVHAGSSETIKVALIGCGGRGGGAALNVLHADPHVKITAVCDIFKDRAEHKLKELRGAQGGKHADRITATPDTIFSGFDGYKQAIDSGVDYVILATSPGFRPLHFAYAVEKNKHVFMEKPHAVDAAGVRSVIETAKKAEQKNLGVCGGYTYRYDLGKRETLKRVHDGAIGDILAVHTTYLTGDLWYRGKQADWSEMENQIRNWYYYTWLSGDFLVEQAIHNVDKAHWTMGDTLPVAAYGQGGRQVRTDEKWGNIWDNFSVVYEYANGARVFLQCRQTSGCQSQVMDHIIGSKGSAQLMQNRIEAKGGNWTYDGDPNLANAYDREHFELIQSIRAGKPMNDGIRSAMSTLMGILGREAAYTGKRITWKQIEQAKFSLAPKEYAWGPNPAAPVALPGKYKLV